MAEKLNAATLLKKIDSMEKELINLRREMLYGFAGKEKTKKKKPSLFGSVKGGDITEEMIEKSKQDLFRKLSNL